MGLTTYFYDTYAFFELISGNPNYLPFSENISIITTRLQLMEFYFGILKQYGKKKADYYYDHFVQFCIDYSDDVLKEAMAFRLLHKKKRLSYVDCMGYILARHRNVLFLTGDKAFEHIKHVHFVK